MPAASHAWRAQERSPLIEGERPKQDVAFVLLSGFRRHCDAGGGRKKDPKDYKSDQGSLPKTSEKL